MSDLFLSVGHWVLFSRLFCDKKKFNYIESMIIDYFAFFIRKKNTTY